MSRTPEGLLKDYNSKLARYHRMCKWCATASHEEQLQQEAHIQQVIKDCADALNLIREFREVSSDEVQKGFKI